MNKHQKQINAFSKGLDRLIENFASEFNLTYAEIIGVLTIKAIKLVTESKDKNEE